MNFATVPDQVTNQQETVIIRRKGERDVALIPASDLAGFLETAHMLRSPRNARRLLSALGRAKAGKLKPGTVMALRKAMLGAARVLILAEADPFEAPRKSPPLAVGPGELVRDPRVTSETVDFLQARYLY